MSRRRILALWLPRLATDRLARERARRGDDDTDSDAPAPWATVVKEQSVQRLAAVDAAAEAGGLIIGQSLAEARAQLPGLKVASHDPLADADALDRLARACDRYTPLVGWLPPDGLALDISGCAHLFGGEEGLRDDLLGRVGAAGFAATAAVADTLGAAWAVARHGGAAIGRSGAAAAIVEPGLEATRRVLEPLPAAALRLEEETAGTLARLGLKTVGTVLEQPRVPLVRRFGTAIARRLDQALGLEDEPISPRLPAPAFLAERRFAEPLVQFDGVTATLASLAATLAAMMERRGKGGRRFALTLFHADGNVHRTEAGASRPLVAPARIAALFRPKLEAISARFETDSGIDLLRLAALEAADARPRQGDLDGTAEAAADIARLLDGLSARLGADAVTRFVPGDSHQPEAAAVRVPALHAAASEWPAAARLPGEPPDRPLRLFARPEPIEAVAAVPDGPPVRFRWRKVAYDVAAAEGPERIASEWWHDGDPAPTRDYFRVEDVEGRRFWLFRRGLFGRESVHPAWYLHGLFG